MAQRIKVALEDDIILGRLQAGTRIDEVSLAQRFSASRTPVREAINKLTASELVVSRPRQGAFVVELTVEKIFEIFDVLIALEGYCVRLAARRIVHDEILHIRECHEEAGAFGRAGDTLNFFKKNDELHGLFYLASGNDTLIEATRNLRRRIEPYRRHATYQQNRMLVSVDEHAAIIGAIERHDADAAEQLMRQHLSLLAAGFTDLVALFTKKRKQSSLAG